MSLRWLTMLALFALGFGTACLVKPGSAEGTVGTQWLDDGFLVQDTGDTLVMENRSHDRAYLALVTHKDGAVQVAPSLKMTDEAAEVSTDGTEGVIVYKLVPVGGWKTDWRKCNGPNPAADCPFPPPGPIPDHISFRPDF